ncbi:MAG: hypothetical protein ACRC6G_13660 [Deefgea sp.]
MTDLLTDEQITAHIQRLEERADRLNSGRDYADAPLTVAVLLQVWSQYMRLQSIHADYFRAIQHDESTGSEPMTDLTQEQRKTLARARAREGKTTPAPWEYGENTRGGVKGVIANGEWSIFVQEGDDDDGDWLDDDPCIVFNHRPDKGLVKDAPSLQSLAIAQAVQLERYQHRRAEIRANTHKTPWFVCTGKLIPDDQLNAYYEGKDDGLYSCDDFFSDKTAELEARIAELQREIDRLCRVHKITG